VRRLALIAAGVLVTLNLTAGCGVQPQVQPERIDEPSPAPVVETQQP
jgi:hypothetical protein